MVGDGQVAEPARVGGARHLLQRVPPVGFVGVAVHDAPDVGDRDQLVERDGLGRLARFRGNLRQVQAAIDAGFVSCVQPLPVDAGFAGPRAKERDVSGGPRLLDQHDAAPRLRHDANPDSHAVCQAADQVIGGA